MQGGRVAMVLQGSSGAWKAYQCFRARVMLAVAGSQPAT